ncbi:unnamed protein product [Boreogadus saida]
MDQVKVMTPIRAWLHLDLALLLCSLLASCCRGPAAVGAASTPDGNPAVMEAKWRSLVNHIQDIHDDHDTPAFSSCAHGPLDGDQRNKEWLDPGSLAAVKFENLMMRAALLMFDSCLHSTRPSPLRLTTPSSCTSRPSTQGFHTLGCIAGQCYPME